MIKTDTIFKICPHKARTNTALHRPLSSLLVLFFVLAPLCFIACAEEGDADALSRLSNGGDYLVFGKVLGVDVECVLHAEAWSGEGFHDGWLEYSRPSSLGGVKIICSGGVWTMECGELSLSCDSALRLGVPLCAICPTGELVGIELLSSDSEIGALVGRAELNISTPITVVTVKDSCGSVRDFGFSGKDGSLCFVCIDGEEALVYSPIELK